MRKNKLDGCRAVALAGLWVLALTTTAPAQTERGDTDRPTAGGGPADNYAARLMYKKAEDILAMGQAERAIKMFEKIVEQYPTSDVRYDAYLAMGRHYVDSGERAKGISLLKRVAELKDPAGKALRGKKRDLYLEAMYLIGVSHYHLKQYPAAFPVLRAITRDYPNTVWANQAYFYIGMCHFSQQNWNKAIEALKLVGTFVDPDSPSVEYVEAGRRFFVKIEDADLPILHRLGKKIRIKVTTSRGDEETVTCTPLSEKRGLFIATIPTEIGPVDKGDNALQVIGGDTIESVYLDDNTQTGDKDVPRTMRTVVVSTATAGYTLATFDAKASAAFLGQPLYTVLRDADMDTSPGRESVSVKLVARYKVEDDQPGDGELTEDLTVREQQQYKVRDQVTLKLSELGDGSPVHTGKFGGSVTILQAQPDQIIDKNDNALHCATGDEIILNYLDELHIGGQSPRLVSAKIVVSGEIDPTPRAIQDVVTDPVLQARKNLVEATAYRELARIFRSLGLKKGASLKADQGLERLEPILRGAGSVPTKLRQQAYQLKWQLHIAQEDYTAAVAACKVFSELFPDSPLVDEALMEIGKIKLSQNDHRGAVAIFQQILSLETSLAKPEAQFRIAEASELSSKTGMEAALKHYQTCARKYPDSEFAGPSLAKMVNYYIETKDPVQADNLLRQIFEDHPDAKFLDGMLWRWAVLAVRMRDFKKAEAKCKQLLFEYPDSPYAEKAAAALEKLKPYLGGDSAS